MTLPLREGFRICAISDWRGSWYKVPYADVYVVTGNMLPNYPVAVDPEKATSSRGEFYRERVERRREIFSQSKLVRRLNAREFLENKHAPVVVVRGDHDFVSLSKLFGDKVYEIGATPSSFVLNFPGQLSLRFGGVRGAKYQEGEWSDEIHVSDFDDLCKELDPNLDILVTHAPPYGMMDYAPSYEGRPSRRGIQGLTSYLYRRLFTKHHILAHLFGHVHQGFGFRDQGEFGNETAFVNSAGGFFRIAWRQGKFVADRGRNFSRERKQNKQWT